MKINPINNYQINRNQKTQAKSNPNFEGVKFVLDEQSPALIEAIKRSCVSPKEILGYKNRFDAVINKLNHYLNKEVLPRYLTRDFVYYIENGKICRNNDDLKIYQEKYPDNILEKIWPKDTVIQVSYRENFIEDYEIVNAADYWDMGSIPGIARNIYLGENGKGPLILRETDYADRVSESGIEGILTFFEKLRTEKFCEGKNKYINDFFRSLLHEQSEYKNYFAIYEANCKKRDELAKNEKNERTQANLKAWLGDNINEAKEEVVKLSKEQTEGSTDVVSRIEEAKRVIENVEKCRMVPNSSSEDTLKIYPKPSPKPSPSQVIQVQPIVTQVERPSKSNITNTLETIVRQQDSESMLYLLGVITFFIGAIVHACTSDKQIIQDKDVNKTEIVTKPTEDARMQKGDINYEEEMEQVKQKLNR